MKGWLHCNVTASLARNISKQISKLLVTLADEAADRALKSMTDLDIRRAYTFCVLSRGGFQ